MTDQDEKLVRLEERVTALQGLDEKVTKFVTYFQIVGVVLLVLGIGGGWLTTRFVSAQAKIKDLSEKLQQSDTIIKQQLDKRLVEAETEFDSYVRTNRELGRIVFAAGSFGRLTNAVNDARIAKKIRPHEGLFGKWFEPVMAPPGHYIAGIAVRFEGNQRGGDDTALNAVELYCLPFLR